MNEYRYTTFDGRTQGRLFHLLHLKTGARAYIETIREGQAWFETERPPGVLAVNLLSQDAEQFSFGFTCKLFFDSRFISQQTVVFACEDPKSNGLAYLYYAVAWPELDLVGAWRVEGVHMNAWIAPDVVQLLSSWGREMTAFQRCLVKAPHWTPECQSLPFSIGMTSFNGAYLWGIYAWKDALQAFGEQAIRRALPMFISRADCLPNAPGNCTLTPISPPPEWQGDYYADATYTSWAPDNEKLIVMDVQCTGNRQPGSWIWYYDLAQGRSVPLARATGCDEFRSEQGIWSDDGQRFVVQNQTSVMLVSLNGKVTRLPVTGYVVGKVTVP